MLLTRSFLNEDQTRVPMLQVYTDAASVEFHMIQAGPEFSKFAELVRMLEIDV
jgi:hypothetical protein